MSAARAGTSTRWLAAARTAAALAGVIAVAGACAGSSTPRLVVAGDGVAFGMAQYDWGAGEPLVLTRELTVCLDAPGRAEVVDVALLHAVDGLRVDGFALQPLGTLPDEPAVDAPAGTLRDHGFESVTWIDSVCPDEADLLAAEAPADLRDRAMHLGVQFSKPHDRTARGAMLLVTYVVDGSEQVLDQAMELVLCGPEDSPDDPPATAEDDDGPCAFWPLERYERA